MSNSRRFLPFFFKAQALFLLVSCASSSHAQLEPLVKVKVHGQNLGDRVVYHYNLTNNSQKDVSAIWIGYQNRDHRVDPINPLELDEPPLRREASSGDSILQATAPAGWLVDDMSDEDGEQYGVSWEAFDKHGNQIATLVEPGGVLTGMSVAVATPDKEYIASHATIYFSGVRKKGDIWKLTVPLERDDTAAPDLSVKFNPASLWPPNGKMVVVKAQIEFKDNLDPNPLVRLESITSSDPIEPGDISGAAVGTDDRSFELRAKRSGGSKEGRTYTITYSATDATGNAAKAIATVVVPHDQGKK